MIEQNARRTKVVKSFEARALTAAEARDLPAAQVDVIRLVFQAKATAAIVDFIRAIKAHRNATHRLPIMADIASWTQATIAGLKEPREVAFGERLTMRPSGAGNGGDTLAVQTDYWAGLFRPDTKVFVGPGNVVLRTVSAAADRAEFEVVQGGTIYPDIDVSVPETRQEAARADVTVKELAPLLAEGLDYLVISGEWPKARIVDYRRELEGAYQDRAPWLILKVDSGAVCERLNELIKDVDGVLVSRREMARTLNPATIPMVTKEIIQLCNDQAKVVVTASEMLASMRRNVTPTRAEVSDVANAVLDGTDAVVLSEEVANGRHGPHAVEVMHRIIRDIEERRGVTPNWVKHAPFVRNEMDTIAYQALKTAERVKAKAIVCITKAGNTALKLASFGAPIPIIAGTFSEAVLRRLSIVRGVEAMLLETDPNLDEVLPTVNDQLVRTSWLKAGDPIIFVAITLSPVGRESSNLFTIQILN